MKITSLQTDYEDAFNEAVSDLDWHRIACRLDERDDMELGRYLREQFQFMAEAVEDDPKFREGIYDEEDRLDRRDRARDMKETNR